MKNWKKALSLALAMSLLTVSTPALAENGTPRTGRALGESFMAGWLHKKCEGFSVEVQSVQVKGQEQRNVPTFLRSRPDLGDLVETRVTFTNTNYSNGPDSSMSVGSKAYLVQDPIVMKEGKGFTIMPKPTLEWSNSDENKKFILDHGDSVTVAYTHIVTEEDLLKRSLPEGPSYPISQSPSATPECIVSPGAVHRWSSFAHVLPGLVAFFRSIFLFFRR